MSAASAVMGIWLGCLLDALGMFKWEAIQDMVERTDTRRQISRKPGENRQSKCMRQSELMVCKRDPREIC